MRVAILDDYQNVALSMADWSDVAARAEITVFNDHLADPDAVVERLAPFDVVCVMRERTPLPRNVIERLPQLKMIASTGPFNAAVDVAAAKERGIYVSTTGGYVESTVELTWALILAAARRIVDESASVRAGGWQTLSRFFLLTITHNWMIPLQYVNTEGLVWLFRVADPFGFKGSGF